MRELRTELLEVLITVGLDELTKYQGQINALDGIIDYISEEK